MCGFLLGLLMMFVVFKFARRGAFWGCRRFGRHGAGLDGRSWRYRRILDWLFSRLDTTHGQEKVIREAVGEIEEAFRGTRGLGRKHIRNLADAIRAEDFGHDEVAEVWTEQDQALEKLRVSMLNALQAVHGVLEPEQRQTLGDMIERRFAMGHHGPNW